MSLSPPKRVNSRTGGWTLWGISELVPDGHVHTIQQWTSAGCLCPQFDPRIRRNRRDAKRLARVCDPGQLRTCTTGLLELPSHKSCANSSVCLRRRRHVFPGLHAHVIIEPGFQIFMAHSRCDAFEFSLSFVPSSTVCTPSCTA
jgi:hypothetical protein